MVALRGTPEMNYTLSVATPADHDWLENLRRLAYLDLYIATWGAWDEDRHQRHFASFLAKGHISIVLCAQTAIGMIQVTEAPDRVTVEEIQLLPEYQGRGWGTTLLKHTIAKAHEVKKDVYLSLGLQNTNAYRLYSRLGFEEYQSTATHFHMRNCAPIPPTEP